MVGVFETEFQHASSTPLPPSVSIAAGVSALHDFEGIIRLSPDCRGCKPIPPPATAKNTKAATTAKANPNAFPDIEAGEVLYYEVEDDLPFIPKRLWSGGVKYNADFIPTSDGCDITVHAPGGFTSTNHWRILRDAIPGHAEESHKPAVQTKDLLHIKTTGATGNTGWYVQIISDARCPRAFASFVKGFLKNSHVQLQAAFIEKLKDDGAQQPEQPLAPIGEESAEPTAATPQRPGRERRPTLGRRRSSIL